MTQQERKKLYTVRWFVRERWGEPRAEEEVLEILGGLLDPESQPRRRPSISDPGQRLLWCPLARTDFPRARTRGAYARGYPRGAVVHFTAGRRNGLRAGLDYQVQQGHLYFLIDGEGEIGQNFPLDSWGYHAGRSGYPGLRGNVSDELVGIEVQCGGKLRRDEDGKYRTWFGEEVPKERVRCIERRSENQEPGAYERYTEAQEEALLRLLLWLHANDPATFELDLVVGHDEVSPGRKNDPGGSLSLTMPAWRRRLRELAARSEAGRPEPLAV